MSDNQQDDKSNRQPASSAQEPQSLGLFSSLKQQPDGESEALLPSKGDEANAQSPEERAEEIRKQRIINRNIADPKIKRHRMNCFETFFACIKGYTTTSIFMIPIAFKEGGWFFSPFPLIVMCIIETTGAVRLVQAARSVGIYSYPDLVEYALGPTFKSVFQVVIALLTYAFTFNSLVFFAKTLKSIMKLILEEDISIYWFALITVIILAPLSWIRTLERFKEGFVFAGFAILLMLVTVIVFVSLMVQEHDNEAGPGWQAFNDEHYWTMISISFVMFEGIPSVLPIMEASDCKDEFSYILVGALGTLLVIDIGFAELCYYAYGDSLKEPLVMLELPEAHPAVIVAKILFAIMILVAYPLIVYVCNQVLEYYLFSSMDFSAGRYWLKNLSRTLVVATAAFLAVSVYQYLHKVIGLAGVILGGFVVMITPSLIHNKLYATTWGDKCLNYFLITYAIVAGIVITAAILYEEFGK